MELIRHRVNTVKELLEVPRHFGIEVDLRDQNGRIILQHEPFLGGEDFKEYLRHYQHGTLILNIKSERIESKVLELLREFKIETYFFLDSSFPMIHQLTREGERRIAVRFSEYEGLDTVLAMAGKASWVWVDCFTNFPLSRPIEEQLHKSGYRLCLVSPDLVGRPADIKNFQDKLAKEKIQWDAVCCKKESVTLWEGFFNHGS